MRSYAPASILIAVAGALSGCIPGDANIVGGRAADSGVVEAVCTPACAAEQRCVNGACVGEGQFRLTLTWDVRGDLDLHVVTPSGGTVFYRATRVGGGMLDRDDTSGTGPENVFWSAAPPPGAYHVCVIPYRITAPTSFRLDVRHPALGVVSRTGQRMPAADGPTATCSPTSPYFVETFTIGAASGDAGTPADASAPVDAAAPTDAGLANDASLFPDIVLPDIALPDVFAPAD